MDALGMLADTPLGKAAMVSATKTAATLKADLDDLEDDFD
jgi:hypothetical protein